MKLHNSKYISALFIATVLMATAVGCSTQKNTSGSRWWHSFNARYNTFYNGAVAYIDGSLEKEDGNKDNFTELIPLYTVANKTSKDLGKSNFDRAIEKSQKAIKLHSIKRRPVWDKKRRKTEKDIEWLGRKEYNPFLWKAWMLMGRSQFHKGNFDEAAATFSYMSRLYKTQPAIYGKARAWLAKSYIEEGWLYDAEDVIRNMKRDSLHWKAKKEWDYTYADYYIHTGEYDKAIPYLYKVIKHEMRRKQKAREWYLMGQLQTAVGNKAMAVKAYKHVIRQNPPYEVEFNARIALTEVMSDTNAKSMLSRLKRMAASDKNKDYLDQVYWAIGNIHMNQKDTLNAISAYEKGNSKSTRNGIEKGVLLLRLGDIYWDKERYNEAQRCYGEAIGLLDKERDDYEMLAQRSKVLDELVPFTDAVHLQDSLQELSHMSEKDRNAAIDRVIAELKKKEKEERDKLAEQNAQDVMARNGGNNNNNQNRTPQTNTGLKKNGPWYFYNQMAVNQGKSEFQKKWGKRENVDNWQRANKTVVAIDMPEEQTQEQLDSIARAEALADSIAQVADSAQNDPHRREYYLAQIPFSEEQIITSNAIIKDGLFHSGVIFKDKLDNLPLSEKALRRLTDSYPDYENMADVYYHLFLLYSRKGMPEMAESYIDKLKNEYPESNWTTLLTDPYFTENAKFGEHIEDSIYAATYDAFKADRYNEVRSNLSISEKRFPLGANRDKFIFIGGLSKLNDGDGPGCIEDMKTLVEKYPQSELSPMAGMIVNGVNAGKKLYGGKFDIGDLWEKRSEILNMTDSTQNRQLTEERNTDFVFILAYSPDSINENKLLFQLAKYNFTSYMVRNFDIAVEEENGVHFMIVAGFRNYDEALQYARQLYSQPTIARLSAKSRRIIISTENLPILGTQVSYDEYDKFYDKHFAPLKISTERLLAEPDIVVTKKEKADDDIPDEEQENVKDNSTFLDIDSDSKPNNGSVTVEPEVTTPENNDDNNTIVTPDNDDNAPAALENNQIVPEENKNEDVKVPVDDGSTFIEEETKKDIDNGSIIVPDKKEEEKTLPNTPSEKEKEVVPTPEKEETADKKEKDETPKKKNITQEKKEEKLELKPAKDLEDEFYFDDDDNQDVNKNNKNKKKEDDNVDDEYYDLDGF